MVLRDRIFNCGRERAVSQQCMAGHAWNALGDKFLSLAILLVTPANLESFFGSEEKYR
jgi:hypothetical protein